MFDPAVEAFFTERKEVWLKTRTGPSMSEEEIEEVQAECDKKFAIETWLPAAAKRAGQMDLSTHPCTFSHPSARKNKNGYVTSVIFSGVRQPDGYLRSGNVQVETDALGNASAMDVYKFLNLEMQDSRKLFEHIQVDSDLAVQLLSESDDYEQTKAGLLKMLESSETTLTSSKIKQVYFPIAPGEYHQLSLLSNSGMIYEMKDRIQEMKFSDEAKELRDLKRKNLYSDKTLSDIYNLTIIGYGGTKPQNISVLNSKNGGKAFLLSSLPPNLKKDVPFPQYNFFYESFRYYDYRDIFSSLAASLKAGDESVINEHISELIDRIVDKMWAVRAVSSDNYDYETSQLELTQKTWLCDEYYKTREEHDNWLENLCREISTWILRTYRKSFSSSEELSDAVTKQIRAAVDENKEALR